jgi:hypothetical protein
MKLRPYGVHNSLSRRPNHDECARFESKYKMAGMTRREFALLPPAASMLQPASKPPFAYRSVSFGSGPEKGIVMEVEPELLRLAANLGFNDLTLQTERYMDGKMEALRDHAAEHGYIKLAKSLGMTLSVWVREFQDWDAVLGPKTIDNYRFWRAVAERYQRILHTILPEIDYLVLTVVESEVRVTKDSAVLVKLIETINGECRRAGKKLIFRAFVWYPEEMRVVAEAVGKIPSDVIVESKCVPTDFHLRGSDNAFIGQAGGRREHVEFDIAGEYNKLDFVACAFTDVLEHQLKYAVSKGVRGITVRVIRRLLRGVAGYGGNPEHPFASVWGQAQEANLWFLGYWASGKSLDQDEIWRTYAGSTFGKAAAPTMVRALRPTGNVIAEAVCVERESFGYSRDYLPGMRGVKGVITESMRAPEGPIPFDVPHSPARWDDSLKPAFERIAAGDPEIIRRKTESYRLALSSAERSLALIEEVSGALPEGAYRFFRWKLEENRYCLIMMCEIELAWMKAIRRARTASQAEKQALAAQIRTHLARMAKLYAEEGEKTAQIAWRGKVHRLRRGEYNDFPAWMRRFKIYTGLEAPTG